MIDLHTHTTDSDGTFTPAELVRAAAETGLDALAISDHDTFAGYEKAEPLAREAGIELVCAIELSTKLRRDGKTKSVHLLGYFLNGLPDGRFRTWLEGMQEKRRERNRRMAERLQELGMEVTLEEVEQLGRNIAGRPHFARILLRKGYVMSLQEAFDRYLGESAKAYVSREEPALAEGIRRILEAGGLPSLPHPCRLGKTSPAAIEELISEARDMDLSALEVFHSEHTESETRLLLELARRYDLAVTGGSDFHGDNKPGICLGTGLNGNLDIPRAVLDDLREASVRLLPRTRGGGAV